MTENVCTVDFKVSDTVLEPKKKITVQYAVDLPRQVQYEGASGYVELYIHIPRPGITRQICWKYAPVQPGTHTTQGQYTCTVPDLGLQPGQYDAELYAVGDYDWSDIWGQHHHALCPSIRKIPAKYIQPPRNPPTTCTTQIDKIANQLGRPQLISGTETEITYTVKLDKPAPPTTKLHTEIKLETQQQTHILTRKETQIEGETTHTETVKVKIPDLGLPQGTYQAKIIVDTYLTWTGGKLKCTPATYTTQYIETHIPLTRQPTKCTTTAKIEKTGNTLKITVQTEIDKPLPADGYILTTVYAETATGTTQLGNPEKIYVPKGTTQKTYTIYRTAPPDAKKVTIKTTWTYPGQVAPITCTYTATLSTQKTAPKTGTTIAVATAAAIILTTILLTKIRR